MNPTIEPSVKQDLAWNALLDETTNYVFYGGAAGGGKSWLGCEWLMYMSYRYPGSRWFVGREELKRLMDSDYITFLKVFNWHQIPKSDWNFNGSSHFIEWTNGSRIDFLDLKYLPSDPLYERYGSTEYTGGWIEEAGEVDFAAFDTLKTRIGRWKNTEYGYKPKMLITCNPKKNWLYQLAYKPFKENRLPANYVFIQALVQDNPWQESEYQKQLEGIVDPVKRERLLQGNWEYADDATSLIDYDSILAMFTNQVDESGRYITADIARYGSDKTVIGIWRGLNCYEVQTYTKQGIDVTAERISALSTDLKIPLCNIVIDDDGVGGGVTDILKGARGFIGNASPIETKIGRRENFKNLRSQAYYLLSDYICDRKLALTDTNHEMREAIKQELEQVKQKEIDNDQKLSIVPKEDIKEVIGRSPDYSDMLMMRMLIELGPRAQHKPPTVTYPNYSKSSYVSRRTIPTISGSPLGRS